ncbi:MULTISPECIES: hypothetical protein [Thermodesulfovibrio]|uniref:Uncharacterized protein n=1 Tax=Thermodesulfovibrio yellowstonii (strain ATCC 51303 / DSM 11347 / YP87) TaxID=289376 RepID=B5YIN4_THEYD|nr:MULTISPECIES: hypothetical protein [Thermodesulfovibrio]ACI20391.1 hypothetical protein THEYE_A0346 [Thermodesulfovibrio yellowstonii DSM 11347]MBC7189809.1 hypothetical protein [Candidatus Aerophobetes bacterium]
MGYREKYYSLIEKLKQEIIEFCGYRFISLVIFDSVASDRFSPASDIDKDKFPEGIHFNLSKIAEISK